MVEAKSPDLRILVIDDRERWREVVRETFAQLGDAQTVRVDEASSYAAALRAIADHPYDLAVVDLALSGEFDHPQDSDAQGLELLRELRNSRYNRDSCGLIVLTGYPTTARTRQALLDYAAHDVIEKDEFDDQVFLAKAQEAIRTTRLRRAAARTSERYRLTITLGEDRFLGSELTGPDRRATYNASRPVEFDREDLIRRSDLLNVLLLGAKTRDAWRREARSIGSTLYKLVTEDRSIHGDLVAARALAERFSDLAIHLSGPSVSFGMPFELLRDNDDYLGLKHILMRRLVLPGGGQSRKPEPFYGFLSALLQRKEALRILVVGANSDGAIPAAEQEATTLMHSLRESLTRLGIQHDVTALIGPDASFGNVTQALRSGRYHIFHYAGHGRHSEQLPEIGGLILRDGTDRITLTAADLNMLVRDTNLNLAFLSCCVGARTEATAGRGEFHGTLEALARADVPVVIGYRWVVADEPALNLTLQFYRNLWRSLTPGDALLEARKAATMGGRGRDDETWASPVLVAQNG
jgi:CheY-like chemotaxis protein